MYDLDNDDFAFFHFYDEKRTPQNVFEVGKFLTLVCLRKTKCIIIVVVLHKQNTKMKEEASASSHEFETQKG